MSKLQETDETNALNIYLLALIFHFPQTNGDYYQNWSIQRCWNKSRQS